MHAHLHTEDTNNETTIPMKRAKQDDEIREAGAIPIAVHFGIMINKYLHQ